MTNEKQQTLGVSFDLSKSRTGYAIWQGQDLLIVGSMSFSNTYDIGHLLHLFKVKLSEEPFSNFDFTWIGFEDVRPVNKHHSEIHFGMTGLLSQWSWETQRPFCRATATKVKKKLTGSGRATKEEMLAAAQARFPDGKISNHDEADAVAVGLVVVEDMINWKQGIHRGELSLSPF